MPSALWWSWGGWLFLMNEVLTTIQETEQEVDNNEGGVIVEGHTTRRCRRASYRESHITKYTDTRRKKRSSNRKTSRRRLKHLPDFAYQSFASPEKKEEEHDQGEQEGDEPARRSLIPKRLRYKEEAEEGDRNTTQILPITHFSACE